MSEQNGGDPAGFSVEPSTPLEAVLNAIMDSTRDAVEAGGGRVRFLFVSVVTEGFGELDSCSAAAGEDLPDEPEQRAGAVVSWLLSEAKQTAQRLGVEVRVLPLDSRLEG